MRGTNTDTDTGTDPEGLRDHLKAHEIRITTHGKMQAWVEFALDFFEKNETRPLILHTLPAKAKDSAESDIDGRDVLETSATTPQRTEKKKESDNDSALLVPRLVSVVEIIKREYLKELDTTLADGRGTLSGLHQYNELGNTAPSNDQDEAGCLEEQRAHEISRVLNSKNYPKLKRKHAFMKITLSRTPLPHFAPQQSIT
ncbi:hypothetical protein BDY19DRAFT_556373 [Irpex rosettiformis]|uniref:Uncharacterized protein n=1 Tax=Irpex rosettiformis TaxID=378272 RepID=A0ACB8TQ16_9APHY|nr:hypothetical protein BDY19DRAFT_556373 [Irpex rosettiformis]